MSFGAVISRTALLRWRYEGQETLTNTDFNKEKLTADLARFSEPFAD